MTPDTIFPIHSVTKTITSFAAMMLVDRGKITLDDPVSKYIPSFAGMKVGVERKDESGKAVLDLVPLRRPDHDRGSAAAHLGDHLRLLWRGAGEGRL